MLRHRGEYFACLMAVAIVLTAPRVCAASLDIKPGHWKKEVTATTNGVAGKPMTLDACFTAKDLDFEAHLKDFPDKSCTWTKKEVSTKKLDVAFSCRTMSGVSLTEVKSAERVVVEATIDTTQAGQKVKVKSSEVWSWVGPDCKKGE